MANIPNLGFPQEAGIGGDDKNTRLYNNLNILTYGDGNIRFSWGHKILGFELIILGKGTFRDYNPMNLLVAWNKKTGKLIATSLNAAPIGQEVIFQYKGPLHIQSCKVIMNIDSELKSVVIDCYRPITPYWGAMPVTNEGSPIWSDVTTNWEDLLPYNDRDTATAEGYISARNLKAEGLYINSAPYSGEYHVLSDGTFMSGGEPSSSSKKLNKGVTRAQIKQRAILNRHERIKRKTKQSGKLGEHR